MSLEQAIIGGLVGNRTVLEEVRLSGLDAETFSDPPCAKAFARMCWFADNDLPIDRDSLEYSLGGQSGEWLEAAQGQSDVSLVVGQCGVLRRHSVISKVQKAAKAFDGSDSDPESALAKYREAVEGIGDLMSTLGISQTDDVVAEAIHNTLGHLTGSQPDPDLIDTGLGRLNKLLGGGLRRGELTIVAGSTSQGKTSLMTTITHRAAITQSLPTILYSYEMTARELIQRFLSMESKIALSVIRHGKVENPLFLDRLILALGTISDRVAAGTLEIIEASGMTAEDIHADVARRIKAGQKLDIVSTDYLQLVEVSPAQIKGSRAGQVAHVSRIHKRIAQEFGVNVLGLSQLNRAYDFRGGTPQLSDLRESGALEQDANQVLFVYDAPGNSPLAPSCPVDYSVKILDLQKNRNGSKGSIEAYFYGTLTQFVDAPAVYQGEQVA